MTKADRKEIEAEISRLEDLMADIVLDKKTEYVLRNKRRLDKLRRKLKEDN